MKTGSNHLNWTRRHIVVMGPGVSAAAPRGRDKERLRAAGGSVGFFPNITHPQALVGQAQGAFEKSMGSNVRVEWRPFNAGPSAIEALFAGAIDMTYVGPNPAINGYPFAMAKRCGWWQAPERRSFPDRSQRCRHQQRIGFSRQARGLAAVRQHARCRAPQLA